MRHTTFCLCPVVERIAEVDEMLLLREEIDGKIPITVPSSVIGQLIEEAHPALGTTEEGTKNVYEHLVHSY